MQKVISKLDYADLLLKLTGSIELSILDELVGEMKKVYKEKNTYLNRIILNLSKINFIKPEGALAIICFCSAIRQNDKSINFELIYPQNDVKNYLTQLGFFTQMSLKAGVPERPEVINREHELKQDRRIMQKKHSSPDKLRPIIFPITTIPKKSDGKEDKVSARDFENMSINFVNSIFDSFEEIFSLPHYNFSGADQHDFLLSNRELYRNIFEHSNSWGIGLIHARPNYGTQVCYYDIGIGFKGSVNKFNSDLENIEWALLDGNSSILGDKNDGHGLTIVQNFVLRRKGTITIRSGRCLLKINNNRNKESSRVKRFPGVQFSYFIPV